MAENPNDMFVHENDEEVIETVEESLQIPDKYVEVKLDSMGKFDAPAVLHFRNYTMEDALILTSAREDTDQLEKLIKVLNNMVYEDFDCSKLLEKELEEIMLTIYSKFWSKEMKDLPYYIDETIIDYDEKNDKDNIGYASFPISAIHTNIIDMKFKEPVKIKINDIEAGFKMPRVGDVVFAQKFVDEKYLLQDRKFSDLEILIQQTRAGKAKNKLDPAFIKEYEDYLDEKDFEKMKVMSSMMLDSLNGKKLSSVEEKLEAFSSLDLSFWTEINKVIQTYMTFGVSQDVEFKEVKTGGIIKRRFSFQLLDFIPPLGSENISTASVSFGD